MSWGQLDNELTFITVVCILIMFFCPAIAGPYSAVHGPATALRAARGAAQLAAAIAMPSSLSSFCSALASYQLVQCVTSLEPLRGSFGLSSILRC